MFEIRIWYFINMKLFTIQKLYGMKVLVRLALVNIYLKIVKRCYSSAIFMQFYTFSLTHRLADQ